MPDDIAADPKLQAAFRKIVQIKIENHYKKAGFMSFGIVQLGQAAATLGDGELAYQAVVRLVNSYWLDNFASMHNPKSLLNMDVSGGLPAVIIQMLAGSAPGKVRLLPALPREWPTGTIEGALCRGQIEIKRLTWKPGRIVATLLSKKPQTISLSVPSDIQGITATGLATPIRLAGSPRAREVSLPQDKPATLDIRVR